MELTKKRKVTTIASCSEDEEEEIDLTPRFNTRGSKTTLSKNDYKSACGSRGISYERLMDKQFLFTIKFPWLENLKEWGWWEYVVANCDCYPNLVRAF